jgi:hypothetical protein
MKTSVKMQAVMEEAIYDRFAGCYGFTLFDELAEAIAMFITDRVQKDYAVTTNAIYIEKVEEALETMKANQKKAVIREKKNKKALRRREIREEEEEDEEEYDD